MKIETCIAALINECHAEEDDWNAALQTPTFMLEAEGQVAIGPWEEEREGRRLVVVRPRRADSKFKEGDICRVGPALDDTTPYRRFLRCSREAELVRIRSDGSFVLKLRGGIICGSAMMLGPNAPVLDYYEDQVRILRALTDRANLLDAWKSPRPERDHLSWEEAAAALERPVAGARFVQGPPGTGKTRLLAHVALSRAAAGMSVIVTAFTHRALDAVADAVAEVRAGLRARDDAYAERFRRVEVEKYSTRDADSDEERYRRTNEAAVAPGRVLLMTTHALFKKIAAGDGDQAWTPHGTVFIDEASQLTLPALVAMENAGLERIYLGDPHQLGPVSKSGQQGEVVDGFRALFHRMPFTVLRKTYRLAPELAETIGGWFYEGKLVAACGGAAADRAHPDVMAARNACDVDPAILSPGIHLLEVRDDGAGSVGEREALVIRDAVAAIRGAADQIASRYGAGAGSDPEIVISCLYRQQVSRIRNALGPLNKGVRVDSVERNQGQTARLAAFLSFGRGASEMRGERIGWVFDYRRFNVALSRPRIAAFVVATPEVLALGASRHNPDTASRRAYAALWNGRSTDADLEELARGFAPEVEGGVKAGEEERDRTVGDIPEGVSGKDGAESCKRADGSDSSGCRSFAWKGERIRVPKEREAESVLSASLRAEHLPAALALLRRLSARASNGEAATITYREFQAMLESSNLDAVSALKALQRAAVRDGLFDLSALVVSHETGAPSRGHFFKGHTRLAQGVDPLAEWRAYIEAGCRACCD